MAKATRTLTEPLPADADSQEQQWVEEEVPWEDVTERRTRVTDSALEQFYDSGTARIITQRNDFLIPQLIQAFQRDEYLNLTPAYQRRLRWDRKQKSLLIESLLMNVPIPPVFLYESDYAKYEVMDGQQRLSTIREFFGNEFELTGLVKWSALNGRGWADLPDRIKAGLERRSLSAVILLAETGRSEEESQEIRRFAFERLNTGGVKLNPQEIRNCIYAGPFNDLLHELSRHELFTRVWDIPPRTKNEAKRPAAELSSNSIYRQMADCEIVLRFFTIRETEKLAGSMKASLDNCMNRYLKPPPDIPRFRREYLDCLESAYEMYGDATFRLLPSGPKGRRTLSRPLYDAVMVGIDANLRGRKASERERNKRALVAKSGAVVKKTEELLGDIKTYELLVGRANTRKSTIDRVELLTTLFADVLRG